MGFENLEVTTHGVLNNKFQSLSRYVRGVNVRGAPYDWRKAPNELGEFYVNLTQLVEDTYYLNNGTRVVFIAHSMGNPVTLYWLNNIVTPEWKKKFIKSFVSLAGVWGGKADPINTNNLKSTKIRERKPNNFWNVRI